MEPKIKDRITFGITDFSAPDIFLNRSAFKHRRSPIIVTLADPNIADVDIQKMMEAGMNVVRFKMSHSTKGEKIRMIGKVDKATAALCRKHGVLDWPVATCVELKTCIVRTGLLEGDEDFVMIKEGAEIILSNNMDEFDKCTRRKIFVDNPYIGVDCHVGMVISISQDEIVARCKQITGEKSIKCVVTKGGKLTNLCLVTVRGGKKSSPYITKKDFSVVKFALQYQIDMIIINYARHVDTLKKVKQYIGKKNKRPLLLCGVCTEEGLKNIDDLIKESDGIVFSREFIAYEVEENSRYRLLLIQKWVGAKCLQAGKPYFISGEVFKEALTNGTHLDSESWDVSNALLDGATGFILRECPDVELVLAVLNTMNELCCNVEPYTNTKESFWRIVDGMPMPINAAESSALACAALANQSNASVIIIPTVTGQTAKILMWLRPICKVVTVSSNTSTTRRLQTYRCVFPLMFKGGNNKNWHNAVTARVQFAVEHAVREGWVTIGDIYITLQRGSEDSAFCDMVRMWTVTISKKHTVECPNGDEEELG